MKLAVLISFSGAGGVERMVMNLVREMALELEQIDLLVIRAKGPHFADIPDNVNIIKLKASHTLTAIPEIIHYLKSARPKVMLVAKDRAGRAALLAKKFARVDTKIFIRLGTNLSTALSHKSSFNRWLRVAPMRWIYPSVTKVIAVSEGVASDTVKTTKLDKSKITVIRNPVVTPDFFTLADSEIPHPWLMPESKDNMPVIIGVGRLSLQKDFDTLIDAFALVRKQRAAKLIILGEGALRESLEIKTSDLGLKEDILLPGFQTNPMCWVKNSSCFVLSSRWEGSPNALTEALALGVPSVSTDCPSGPEETLNGGEYGPLIKIGDSNSMSEAIINVLDDPLPPETLKHAVREYHANISAQNYLRILREA